MIVTIDCRDIMNCKVTIVLCNGAQISINSDANFHVLTFILSLSHDFHSTSCRGETLTESGRQDRRPISSTATVLIPFRPTPRLSECRAKRMVYTLQHTLMASKARTAGSYRPAVAFSAFSRPLTSYWPPFCGLFMSRYRNLYLLWWQFLWQNITNYDIKLQFALWWFGVGIE